MGCWNLLLEQEKHYACYALPWGGLQHEKHRYSLAKLLRWEWILKIN